MIVLIRAQNDRRTTGTVQRSVVDSIERVDDKRSRESERRHDSDQLAAVLMLMRE
jgi:hypothetical protein